MFKSKYTDIKDEDLESAERFLERFKDLDNSLTFTFEIENDLIKGLEAEFGLLRRRTEEKPWELELRLKDGQPHYGPYEGWKSIGHFDFEEAVKKMYEIRTHIKQKNYNMVLESISHSADSPFGGHAPYYRIKFFSIDGKLIIRL